VGTWTTAVFLLGQQIDVWLVRVHDLGLGIAAGIGVVAVAGGALLLARAGSRSSADTPIE
jgi:hypothetical protein